MTAITKTAAETALACPILWPEGMTHTVEYAALDPSVPGEIEPLVPKARELAALGDALRALQAKDGASLAPDASRELALRSARLVSELAEADPVTPEAAAIMRLRADALLEGAASPEAAQREGALTDPQPLTVFCGPLCTWRAKTRAGLHTVIAATAHEEGDRLMASLDASLEDALKVVRAQLDLPDLGVHDLLPIQITDLIAAGGEASAFPKHFAYFLPEDENIRAAEKKTMLFHNAYALRYGRMSKRLADALLDGPAVRPETDVMAPLLGWVRGHDVMHGTALPGDGRIGSPDVGHEPFMSLQETIANVYGLLLSVTPTWLEIQRATADDVVAIYLAEMLHYMRRGPVRWGDAGAGFIELNFLERGGYVEIGGDGRIAWETDKVIEGSIAHAKALASEVIATGEAATVERFLDRYAWGQEVPAVATVAAIESGLPSVPTGVAYC